MKILSEYIVRFVELLEAEGRLAKHYAVRILLASLVWGGAMMLLFFGIFVLALASYLFMSYVMPPYLALSIIGLALLSLGIGFILAGRKVITDGFQSE